MSGIPEVRWVELNGERFVSVADMISILMGSNGEPIAPTTIARNLSEILDAPARRTVTEWGADDDPDYDDPDEHAPPLSGYHVRISHVVGERVLLLLDAPVEYSRLGRLRHLILTPGVSEATRESLRSIGLENELFGIMAGPGAAVVVEVVHGS